MNPISEFFVQNIVVVFFFYGLAFFAMGLALLLATRRPSEFRFARAIRPLAVFGIVHGAHEWFEMFQKIAAQTYGYSPPLAHEVIRLIILVVSFLALLIFGVSLLTPERLTGRQAHLIILGITGFWLLITVIVVISLKASLEEATGLADVLSRYLIGIPGGLLGTWALMVQQRTFREHGMPQFGRDLVWCATALLLYGAIGQFFVRQTALFPSTFINNTLFLDWFGIPVQLFRGVMATVLAIYMIRALNAFELENQRQLDKANQAKLAIQAAALEAERRSSQQMEQLNEELRLTTRELSLLLDLSNLLAAPLGLQDRLHSTLGEIVHSLNFPTAGIIMLMGRKTDEIQVRVLVGLSPSNEAQKDSRLSLAVELGQESMARGVPMCWHLDGKVFELTHDRLEDQECRKHPSPTALISLPLSARQQVIGCLVLNQAHPTEDTKLTSDEFELIIGIGQQLGLSIENARLYQEAQEREKRLSELLHQVVTAQEAERQRIALELHDATGQSLTAIALGLRGAEAMMSSDPTIALEQVKELKTFSTNALGELRQIITDLRPSQLDDLGLVPALQWYIQEFEKRFSIHATCMVEGDRRRLSPEYETVLFRVTQEALTNIAKHAHASNATVKLEFNSMQVSVSIEDDGRGFDPTQVMRGNRPYSGWGLLGIQERVLLIGGRYAIDSEPGYGTRIRVDVPLDEEAKDAKDTPVAG